jgi:hypothetical protein
MDDAIANNNKSEQFKCCHMLLEFCHEYPVPTTFPNNWIPIYKTCLMGRLETNLKFGIGALLWLW